MNAATIGESRILNTIWEQHILNSGTDFVYFVDISTFSSDITSGCNCAVLFGKALSKDYIRAVRDGQPPKTKEVLNTERKMDNLAVKIASQLEQDGYTAIGKLKTGLLPHKTVALRAGLGFIGKNNLLITPKYGCALMLGKVLTNAPFTTISKVPQIPQCGSCRACVDICPNHALLGTTWTLHTAREEILTRRQCSLCVQCMAACPFTAAYIKD